MTVSTPTPDVAASGVGPPVEPVRHDWDDDPRTYARDDARYWDDLYDRDED